MSAEQENRTRINSWEEIFFRPIEKEEKQLIDSYRLALRSVAVRPGYAGRFIGNENKIRYLDLINYLPDMPVADFNLTFSSRINNNLWACRICSLAYRVEYGEFIESERFNDIVIKIKSEDKETTLTLKESLSKCEFSNKKNLTKKMNNFVAERNDEPDSEWLREELQHRNEVNQRKNKSNK